MPITEESLTDVVLTVTSIITENRRFEPRYRGGGGEFANRCGRVGKGEGHTSLSTVLAISFDVRQPATDDY